MQVGVRYKCTARRDYDICETCEEKVAYRHPLIKIVNPSRAAALKAVHRKYLLHNRPADDDQYQSHRFGPLHPSRSHHGVKGSWPSSQGPSVRHLAVTNINGPTSREKEQQERAKDFEVAAARPSNAGHVSSITCQERSSQLKLYGVRAISTAMASSSCRRRLLQDERPNLRFVRHVTCPDGTRVPPGTVFSKTWRVRNDGPVAWPPGSALVYSSGDRLPFDEPVRPVNLPCPGAEVDITVRLSGQVSSSCTSRPRLPLLTDSPTHLQLQIGPAAS